MSAPAPLLIIVGPTGSGKTDLALELAETFQGEIVNCDSLQLHRRLNIGTAKVPVEERRGIPHHLLDLLEPDDIFTAGDYARLARPLLKEITAR
ncbi:MAG: isopentenyl transferase family protein, partial [Bryobacteraceae bacterium]